MIERPDLVKDPHFTAPQNFSGNPAVKEEFDAILLEWLLAHTKAEVIDRAQEAGYPSAPLNDMSEVFTDPHLLARNFFYEIDHPHTGNLRYPGPPFRMSADAWCPRPAPLLGEHTEEVLRGLGYADEAIRSLMAEAAV
jgi:crotonobetainyl-CoA:carnitine CoA-transferase CaiB-like acyl-CoA transferase